MIVLDVCFNSTEPVLDFCLKTAAGEVIARSPGYGAHRERDRIQHILDELAKSGHDCTVTEFAAQAMADAASGDTQFTAYHTMVARQFREQFEGRSSTP